VNVSRNYAILYEHFRFIGSPTSAASHCHLTLNNTCCNTQRWTPRVTTHSKQHSDACDYF